METTQPERRREESNGKRVWPGLCGTAAAGLICACWNPRRTGRVQGEEPWEERSLETSPNSQTRANCKQDKLKETHTQTLQNQTLLTKDDDEVLTPA